MMKNSQQSWSKRWKISHDMNIETRISASMELYARMSVWEHTLYRMFLLRQVGLPCEHSTWQNERDGMKERQRKNERGAERGRDKNTEKERARWDKLITSGLVFLSYASDSTEVFCLADSVFGWDVFIWARIHTGEVIFLNGWATITLTRWTVCGYFFFPLITAYCRQHESTEWQPKMTEILCFVKSLPSSL